jgi:hypothetical protein
MFLRWQHRARLYEGLFGHTGVRWNAILAESVRVDGRPRQRHVAFLGSFLDRSDFGPRSRVWFWDNVNARLDRLGSRLSPQDRKKVEEAIARKVKRPTPEEIEWCAELDAKVQALEPIFTGHRKRRRRRRVRTNGCASAQSS